MLVFLTRLFCAHKSTNFIRNIYGDEINRESWRKIYRSWWRCDNCGGMVKKEEFFDE